jgi:hypothetical protein
MGHVNEIERRRILGGVLIALGLLPLVSLAHGLSTAAVAVFLLGAAVLLLGGPIIPIGVVVFPIVWSRRLSWNWRIVASVPALTLGIVAVGYALPTSGILPRGVFANLGPPSIASFWAAVNFIYVGVLAWTLPRAIRSNAEHVTE